MTTAVETALLDRVATAPVSWGVCEVPGWGHQLPAERVLAEMSAAGFAHTELGAWGFLPTDSVELRSKLDSHDLTLLGGFVPLVLHDAESAARSRDEARRWAELIAGAGGRFFATCAVSRPDCWRQAPLDDSQWALLCESLSEIDALTDSFDLKQVYHSHFGSLVESDAEFSRILEGTDVSVVLDTAHLALGGTDLLQLLDSHGHRVGLVHLKDLDTALAASLNAGRLSLMQAVQRGLFPPLGQGGAAIAEVVTRLEESGLRLWYVLEQDAAIAEGDLSAVAGLRRNADQGLAFLRDLQPALAGSGAIHNHQRIPEG
ncbi:MAG: sugar phosphate isomerase/epimerase [Acidimicrobiaceae bacterium]|nr:sugar phosphate isomerase/epimerase [Acidimicrobiaceae bacterium]MCY4176452.1 sugar phosphate isomerase/epimerase [Acidimicrobiaceae bacterium]MCY4280107.1 sugar phosphate isomerase/epimerase [Acidimicrobiaceae bacterium]